MKFAFFGTDEFSVRVLDTLKKAGLLPALIITVPDQPKGRKMVLTPPLAKIWAEKNGVEVIQPASLKNLEFSEVGLLGSSKSDFENLKWDFFLVASYGKIIPQDILDLPTYGTLNIHPSLLPKYRGPSPLETAILNGDEETGVTIMLVDALMDHGPIVAIEKIELNDKNFEQLRDKLAEMGAKLLIKILPDYLDSKLTPQAQDHDQATFTKKFTKEDGSLDPQTPAINRYRKILALNPWPGTYLDYPGPEGKIRLIIKQAHLEEDKLVYDRVVPEGRKEMDWKSFLNGLHATK
ncbi:MAG TPA: methionyl-tRNA formyltransferase [Candidatus Paceibacterota bacterium]|nr:methionyl-tRNA formyltransferase [Candidatus Paceibacterota bacterium]